jgi:tyrosine-specific transport protein
MYVRKSRQLGGILLVSGTTIGAGMLALPVTSGILGFFPSCMLFIFYWILSIITALFLLEVNLHYKEPVNLITMAKHTLGKKGEMLSWILYLFLLYSLTGAYLTASGPLVADFFNIDQSNAWPTVIFLLVFGMLIFLGTKYVDRVNRLLMVGLFIFYMLLVFSVFSFVNEKKLFTQNFSYVWLSIPIIVTSFGFHIVIPSLTNYLHKDAVVLKRVIFLGSFFPLAVYLLWEYVCVGSIDLNGPFGLYKTHELGYPATFALNFIVKNPLIKTFSSAFSFFAIATSFLGVGLSLSHFLADGFRIHPTLKGRLLTLIITFLPPLLFALFYPRGFMIALEYAGIFVAILLGILPVLMAWRARKTFKTPFIYKVRGGIPLMLFVIGAYLIVIISVLI